MRIAFALLVCAVLAASASAEESKQQFVKGASISLRDDTAYALVRTNVIDGDYIMDAIFVRSLNEGELSAAIERHQKNPKAKEPPNVVRLHGDDFYLSSSVERVFILALQPGTYVLAGIATSPGAGIVCTCMGTVRFEAKAGVVTDLGTLLMARDDIPTTIPELTTHVRGKDIDIVPRPYALGLRPFADGMTIPAALGAFPRVVADYRAVARFPNYFGASVDRLAPVAGVIDYDGSGQILDLKAAPVSGPQRFK